ncbi:MAG: sulfatase-like hydrolase/transferase [Planctomycetes bacterium]|nr:sulfatase-like hydrolase/transferase [Planctomycetota bacterium]
MPYRFILPALLVLLLSPLSLAAEDRAPNVVLIMVDDLGYNDLGCYGHPRIKTPVLDRLADEGVRLTSFYCGATVCTPSRMALMTGAYATRVGWTQGVVGYKMGPESGMSPKALTIAEVFKSEGYATAISGKWHLGEKPPCRPHGQGFDFSYYITKSNNQTKKLWRGDELVEDPFANPLLTEQFTREAIRFIKQRKDKPFFLYIPYSAPHFPVQAHPDWKGKSDFGAYGDVVEELDSCIGEILDTLKAEKIDQDTIVVFLSDNGPETGQAATATPYRGRKWSALEGANRVPCIVRWHGNVPAGRESDALIAAIDLLPTLCHACGIDLQAKTTGSPVIDGVNVWDTLLGRKVEHPRNDLLFWHGMGQFDAIRVGQWKLFLDRKAATRPHKQNSAETNRQLAILGQGKGPLLFNLAEEPNEMTDLSAKYPEKVKEMRALAEKRLGDIRSNVVPIVE